MTSLLSHSSGAMRKASCLDGNSVAVVVKGLAVAPPASAAMSGVWTSTKSSLRKKVRRPWMSDERRRRMCAIPGLARRSICRLRVRVSSSSNVFGKLRREGLRISGSLNASTDNCPCKVVYGWPWTAVSINTLILRSSIVMTYI